MKKENPKEDEKIIKKYQEVASKVLELNKAYYEKEHEKK